MFLKSACLLQLNSIVFPLLTLPMSHFWAAVVSRLLRRIVETKTTKLFHSIRFLCFRQEMPPSVSFSPMKFYA